MLLPHNYLEGRQFKKIFQYSCTKDILICRLSLRANLFEGKLEIDPHETSVQI